MAINQFVPFAVGAGASVVPIETYLANTTLLANGFQVGVADENYCNRTWRQSSIIASVIAQYINLKTGQNTVDDGTTATLLSQLGTALSLQGYVADTSGVVNTLTATITPAPTLQDGLIIAVKVALTNTGITTFNLNGLGAYSVNTVAGPLTGGELTSGKIYQMAWLSASSSWLLLNYQTTAATVASNDNSNKIATTAWIRNAGYATLASPAFTGNPTAPTAGPGDDSTLLATTAFVRTAINNYGATLLPTGTRSVFAQANAPVGWTRDTSDAVNNRMLRVVSDGTGGGVGGVHDPVFMNVVPAHTHGFTTGGESAQHTHYDSGHTHTYVRYAGFQPQSGSATPCWWATATGTTSTGYANLTTQSAGHTHSGSTDNGSSQTAWQPRYVNLIVCTRN